MSLIHNERMKLTANWLNALSAASIAVGGFAQLAPLFAGVTNAANAWLVLAFGAIWFTFGIVLHGAAHVVLTRLKE